MYNKFMDMIGSGRVTRGRFTTGPDDPNHVPEHGGQYSSITGNIHIEPVLFERASTGDPTALQALVGVVLHESAHAMKYGHSQPAWHSPWGAFYNEFPFNHLQPGNNSCVKYS
jgi:hypothetical protein